MVKIKSFTAALSSKRSVYVDTNILIYHLQDMLPYSDLTQVLFDGIKARRFKGNTSVLSLLELNVRPYQLNQVEHAIKQIALLEDFPNFWIHPLNLEMADLAASLRAKYNLKTPDAIHVACAISSECNALVANDKSLKKIKEIDCVHLSDFV